MKILRCQALLMIAFSVLGSQSLKAKDSFEARINHFPSTNPAASSLPVIVLIPGGASFSSKSWGPIDALQRSFDVITVDPPGTGGLKKHSSYTYEGVVSAIERELNTVTRPLILSGISFGCVYAADLATRGKYKVVGYVGFAGLVTPSAFKLLSVPNPHLTKKMKDADHQFQTKPSEETWRAMLKELVPIYFSPPFHDIGRKLLLGDQSHFRSYLDVFFPHVAGKLGTGVADRLKGFPGVKVLAAGENDHLVPSGPIETDAKALGATFEKVPKASHFVLFEAPDATAKLFEKYFLNQP